MGNQLRRISQKTYQREVKAKDQDADHIIEVFLCACPRIPEQSRFGFQVVGNFVRLETNFAGVEVRPVAVKNNRYSGWLGPNTSSVDIIMSSRPENVGQRRWEQEAMKIAGRQLGWSDRQVVDRHQTLINTGPDGAGTDVDFAQAAFHEDHKGEITTMSEATPYQTSVVCHFIQRAKPRAAGTSAYTDENDKRDAAADAARAVICSLQPFSLRTWCSTSVMTQAILEIRQDQTRPLARGRTPARHRSNVASTTAP
jgi:hypothetical protein